MKIIDRSSIIDSKSVFEKFLTDRDERNTIIEFLCSAIDYADTINSNNWNLNLDINGKFIRFNTGQEYCIEISKEEILILCDRVTLKKIKKNYKIDVTFLGHSKQKKVYSSNIDEVPDCLAKTKNSIGCIFKINKVTKYLQLIKQSNFLFIKEAIKTVLMLNMKNAHSMGAVEYLSNEINRQIPNPLYKLSKLIPLDKVIESQINDISKAKKLSSKQRQKLLEKLEAQPNKTTVSQTIFNRNQYVIAEVLHRANGICERCNQHAPFIRDNDQTPYLEVHHIIPLAENGADTVGNAIALCPNCHRQAHYGKNTYWCKVK